MKKTIFSNVWYYTVLSVATLLVLATYTLPFVILGALLIILFWAALTSTNTWVVAGAVLLITTFLWALCRFIHRMAVRIHQKEDERWR